MEVLAAVMAVVYMQRFLPPYFIMFVDNQAGKAALQKGYGNDGRVNAIITAFWTLAAHHGWFPAFKYVRSEHNISDPISRHQTSMAEQAGWQELHIDSTAFLKLVESLADDPTASISFLLAGLLLLPLDTELGGVDARCGEDSASPATSSSLHDYQPAEDRQKERMDLNLHD